MYVEIYDKNLAHLGNVTKIDYKFNYLNRFHIRFKVHLVHDGSPLSSL